MYQVRLQDFEGPLDLLLFLIQREELDIFDIPVARITDEYLSYVNSAEALDLDGVADFIYLAAMLIRIKAKMLLPKPDLDDEGDPVDPRQALVEQLLQYIQFKDAAEELAFLHQRRSSMYTRGEASRSLEHEREVDETFVNTTVFDLIRALRRVLREVPEEEPVAMDTLNFTVAEQRKFVMDWVRLQQSGRFGTMVKGRAKGYVIATFLAVLELAQHEEIIITPDPAEDDFIVAAVQEIIAQA